MTDLLAQLITLTILLASACALAREGMRAVLRWLDGRDAGEVEEVEW